MTPKWNGDERRQGRSAAELGEHVKELRQEWEALHRTDTNGVNDRERAYALHRNDDEDAKPGSTRYSSDYESTVAGRRKRRFGLL